MTTLLKGQRAVRNAARGLERAYRKKIFKNLPALYLLSRVPILDFQAGLGKAEFLRPTRSLLLLSGTRAARVSLEI